MLAGNNQRSVSEVNMLNLAQYLKIGTIQLFELGYRYFCTHWKCSGESKRHDGPAHDAARLP